MAIINTSTKNIKTFIHEHWFEYVLWFLIILSVSALSFSFGAVFERTRIRKAFPVTITENQDISDAWYSYHEQKEERAQYYASKNGSKAYPLDCSVGNRIKDENKIFFDSLEQAQGLGFELSSRC